MNDSDAIYTWEHVTQVALGDHVAAQEGEFGTVVGRAEIRRKDETLREVVLLIQTAAGQLEHITVRAGDGIWRRQAGVAV